MFAVSGPQEAAQGWPFARFLSDGDKAVAGRAVYARLLLEAVIRRRCSRAAGRRLGVRGFGMSGLWTRALLAGRGICDASAGVICGQLVFGGALAWGVVRALLAAEPGCSPDLYLITCKLPVGGVRAWAFGARQGAAGAAKLGP